MNKIPSKPLTFIKRIVKILEYSITKTINTDKMSPSDLITYGIIAGINIVIIHSFNLSSCETCDMSKSCIKCRNKLGSMITNLYRTFNVPIEVLDEALENTRTELENTNSKIVRRESDIKQPDYFI